MKAHPVSDDGTKKRLIEAAGEVFAKHGFRVATIREICKRANASVSAVNYHFRDKEGLYAAVLEHSHQSAVKKYPPELGLGGDAPPEEKLRAFIVSFLLRVMDEGVPAWHGKLMAQEISYPTEALNQVVRNSIQPLYLYLAGILGELLKGPNTPEGKAGDGIFLCAMSIVGQCLHHFTARRVIAMLQPKGFDSTDLDRIADHITRFSLGGIRELQTGGFR